MTARPYRLAAELTRLEGSREIPGSGLATLALWACTILAGQASGQTAADLSVAKALEPIRDHSNLPALAGAIVTSEGVLASGVVGVRKLGSDVPATIGDDWHLGSDTKAMTATLVGLLVDDGKLQFENTIGYEFPEIAPGLPASIRGVTVEQLLAHRSGLPHDPAGGWWQFSGHGSVTDQRLAAVRAAGKATLQAAPGSAYGYSNWGYEILGAIAERVGHRRWEDLMRQRVFGPLNMEHVGFGGTGTRGLINQPWPHVKGKPMETNGPDVDNPPVMAPAGEVHCPIGEWAKFIANELRGLRGEPSLLSPETFRRLHTPAFGGNYAGGWILAGRAWAGGAAYNHNGSNTMNYAVAWLAPGRNMAILACTNEGDGFKACDEAVGALLRLHDEIIR